MANANGIKAIQAMSARLGWPMTNHRDLDRDCAVLSRADAPTCFGWVVRDTGTLLALPGECASIRNCEWMHTVALTPCFYYYWFNGTILIPLTFANFIATLEATLQPAEYADTREYDEVLHRWQRHQDYR